MRKHVLHFALSAGMLAAALAGCGGEGNGSGSVASTQTAAADSVAHGANRAAASDSTGPAGGASRVGRSPSDAAGGNGRDAASEPHAAAAGNNAAGAAGVAADSGGSTTGHAGAAGAATQSGGATTANTGAAGVAADSGGPASGNAGAAGAAASSRGATAGSVGTGSGGMVGSAGAAAHGGDGGGGSGGRGAETATFHPCPTDGAPCKLMPFGDSITDGYNADTPGGYRVELFRLAHASGKNVTFVGSGSNGPDTVDGAPFPHNHEGHSGWTIAPAGGRSGISTLVDTVMPQHTPHIVLLMIGTNDAIDNYQMAQAPMRLGQLIDAVYAQLPDVTIIVAQLIPARAATTQGDDAELNTRIQTFNQAIPGVVKARADAGKHIFAVDMYKPFAEDPRPLFEDQWHPNAAGYALIGTTWYAALVPLL